MTNIQKKGMLGWDEGGCGSEGPLSFAFGPLESVFIRFIRKEIQSVQKTCTVKPHPSLLDGIGGF